MLSKAIRKVNSVDALLYLLAALAFNRITDWLPESVFNPFPFYTTEISWQGYYFYITGHFAFILFWNALMKMVPSMAQLFYFYRAVEIVALFDFLLIFEKPFAHIGSYGLEFTDLRILIYFTLYILWKADR